MSVAITDLGTDVQFAFTGSIASENFVFNKSTMRVKQGATLVYVTNSDSFNQGKDNKVLELSYVKVSSPTYASNDALYAGLLAMIESNANPSYDEATDTDKVTVLNPDSGKWTSSEHLVDESAMTAGDYYYVIPMEGYKNLHLHWNLTTNNAGDTVAMDIYETNNPAATASSLTDWVDKTTALLSATQSATGVAGSNEETEMIADRTPMKYLIHINVTSVGNTGTADLYIKKSY